MERRYDHNSNIVYVDPKGIRHAALVTAWWGVDGAGWDSQEVFGNPKNHRADGSAIEVGEPGCNLVFCSGDPARRDSCGRQTEHATSVVHKSLQSAPANYWCWPDEA